MTKPREKTRDELPAEIEEGKRKSGSLKIGKGYGIHIFPMARLAFG